MFDRTDASTDGDGTAVGLFGRGWKDDGRHVTGPNTRIAKVEVESRFEPGRLPALLVHRARYSTPSAAP